MSYTAWTFVIVRMAVVVSIFGHGAFQTEAVKRGTTIWTHKTFDRNDFEKGFHALVHGRFNPQSAAVVSDPDGSSDDVLRVFYPRGSYIRTRIRGVQFYSKTITPRSAITLSYDIYFSRTFDFKKGGKLPGLWGGDMNSCKGGHHATGCFSTRFMWRRGGAGEVYAYLPAEQRTGFCEQIYRCDAVYGNSMGRGNWHFRTGQWQNIAQHVRLNTPGKMDGEVKVWHDGRLVYDEKNLVFRDSSDVKIEGIFFSTFFGGSSSSWAPTRDCYTYFKNFVLSTDDHAPVIIG